MKKMITTALFLTSLSVMAGDDSARQECIKDAQKQKELGLAVCEKKTGDERSDCINRVQNDYYETSKRCDEKYPVNKK